MYTSVQTRASNPQTPKVDRWALNLFNVKMTKQPIVGEDHTKHVISMREHVMPLLKKYKEDVATHVRNLLTNQAWTVIIDKLKQETGINSERYAQSKGLEEDIQAIHARLQQVGFKTLTVMYNPQGNSAQIQSLIVNLQRLGYKTISQHMSSPVFLNHSIILGVSDFLGPVFELSYHMPGPKSVEDVEGNDNVFVSDCKAEVKYIEAVGVVAWKNYSGFRIS